MTGTLSKNGNDTRWAPGEFTVRVLSWVDGYLVQAELEKRRKRILSILALACLAIFALGICSHYLYQQLRHDTYASGYQARELEQFHHTWTEANLKVVSVVGQRVELQPINPDGTAAGGAEVKKFCPGFPIRWVAGEVLSQLTYEERPEGDGGRGCENISQKELGFKMWRNPTTLESVNLLRR